MGTQPWIKLWLEARTDRKLDRLTDAQHRVWFNLLLYAAEQDDRGTFTNGGMLAIEVSKGRQKALDATIATLLELHIIEDLGDGTYAFHAFEERQTRKIGKPSDDPEAVAERMRRYRARKAEEAGLEGSAVTRNGRNAVGSARNGVTGSENGTEECTSESGARDQSEPENPQVTDSVTPGYTPLRVTKTVTPLLRPEGEVEEDLDQTPVSSMSPDSRRTGRGSYPQDEDPTIAIETYIGKLDRDPTADELRSVKRWVKECGSGSTCVGIGYAAQDGFIRDPKRVYGQIRALATKGAAS